MNDKYQASSAVLFIIFNRPDTTEKVFGQIKQARPARLYVAADGPRTDKPGEQLLCEQARNITRQIDWPCEVKTLFRDSNMGCKNAVSSAITWFFENEEEGIVLEDDCLPTDDFFRFCDTMLEKYRHDTRIRHISGCNFQHGKKWGTASYYFSNLTHVWGWAGWRRVWKDYEKELFQYHVNDVRPQLETLFTDRFIVDVWESIFKLVKTGGVDTWDYQLTFLNFFNNSLSVIPNVNLITNIGFGESSTHTNDVNNINANLPVQALGNITHPLYILPQKQADIYTLNADFDIASRWKKYNKPKYKAKRWFKGLFK
ncbi:nucleotide-diphospho-sugar transferase [Mucilaginibacter sp. 14171R-50]|uniref:nucleotide-diphospho-sugar transferase n=1 Tax=Mucilaginibacter sp. 14171R-50 TaxID=2703789 RepID=UPI00138B868D|nr:nucleotide-diphospho-sugar transferase [Mucilaginibacter sp. 14171R-50]QHS54721.1 nucleotide-diphospho-sugar transferase [Mucilaginibacter sp. 14171R-50]